MKYFAAICFFLLGSFTTLGQGGKVYDQLEVPSKILQGNRNYAVYLPPDYDHSERSYPILYLLHGAGDDHSGWVQFGEVRHIADQAIRSGAATPMIIVMPDAQSGRLGYFNSPDGSWRYEDFFFEEFIPFIEDHYRVRREKRYRAVAGLSMGGGGSMLYALKHPELFSSSCPLSAYMGALSLEKLQEEMERRGEHYSPDLLQSYYQDHAALPLLEDADPEALKKVRWYIDCGDEDFLYEGNSLVHIAMTKAGIPHEYRVRDGAHNWTYWRTALPEVLTFVSEGFHQF